MAQDSIPGGIRAARPRRATLAAGFALAAGGLAPAACGPWRSPRAGRGEPGDPDGGRDAPYHALATPPGSTGRGK